MKLTKCSSLRYSFSVAKVHIKEFTPCTGNTELEKELNDSYLGSSVRKRKLMSFSSEPTLRERNLMFLGDFVSKAEANGFCTKASASEEKNNGSFSSGPTLQDRNLMFQVSVISFRKRKLMASAPMHPLRKR